MTCYLTTAKNNAKFSGKGCKDCLQKYIFTSVKLAFYTDPTKEMGTNLVFLGQLPGKPSEVSISNWFFANLSYVSPKHFFSPSVTCIFQTE